MRFRVVVVDNSSERTPLPFSLWDSRLLPDLWWLPSVSVAVLLMRFWADLYRPNFRQQRKDVAVLLMRFRVLRRSDVNGSPAQTVAVLLMRFIEFNDGRVEVWISMLPFSLWDSAFTKSGAIKTSYLVAVLLMRFVREFGSWKHHGQVSCRSPYEIRKRLFWWHCTNYRLPFSLWDSCYDSRTGKAEPLTFPVAVLLMRFRKCQVVLG